MPVLTYRVTAVAEHDAGRRVPPSGFHEPMSDWLADAARECIRSLCDEQPAGVEPADYRVAQVTVEPVDEPHEVALVLPRRDVEAIVAALELLTPPGDAGRERQPLLAALRLSLVDPVEQPPALTLVPGGLPDADSPEEVREAAYLSRGNPERWSDDDADC